MGWQAPPFYGKDDEFFIAEAMKSIAELKAEFPSAVEKLEVVEECVKHFADESEK